MGCVPISTAYYDFEPIENNESWSLKFRAHQFRILTIHSPLKMSFPDSECAALPLEFAVWALAQGYEFAALALAHD